MRGYFTLPGRHKKLLEEGGSYRAVTKIRPVATRQPTSFSMTSSSTAPPPPDHPPPPPPATQVVTVDPKAGSDYAKVCVKSPDRDAEMSPRSSFKPTDNAKLYASPENVQSVAFRCQRHITVSALLTPRQNKLECSDRVCFVLV
jgi:SH3 and multiple ankyrin repeat domains protein